MYELHELRLGEVENDPRPALGSRVAQGRGGTRGRAPVGAMRAKAQDMFQAANRTALGRDALRRSGIGI